MLGALLKSNMEGCGLIVGEIHGDLGQVVLI